MEIQSQVPTIKMEFMTSEIKFRFHILTKSVFLY